jgi:hypothetical protein
MNLFEFKMSYLEQGYHKPGDRPFSFPPDGVEPKIDANLIQIEGRNGTGKTTLLNCLALATGYLELEKDLETKPTLKRKLQELYDNPTLEYCFRICCDKPEPIELRIERARGQKSKCWLNSKPVDPDTIVRKFDVVFLTEDDPKKVVNASLGKLAKYFNELEKGLVSIQDSLNSHLLDIGEFHDFKRKEGDLLKDIETLDQSIKKKRATLNDLREKLEKAELKDKVRVKLELLSNENQIVAAYNAIRKKYDQLKDKTSTELIRKLYRERLNLSRLNDELKRINGGIVQICTSLGHYGIILQAEKILKDDYSELNQLNQKMQPQKKKETVKLQMIDDMIELFKRYPEGDVVPLINKSVQVTLSELLRTKASLASDRIFALLNALNSTIEEKRVTALEFDKVQDKITVLSQKTKDLEGLEGIQKAYVEAEKKYSDLQIALSQGRKKLLSQWEEVRSIHEDPETIRDRLQEAEISTRAEETMKRKSEESLRLLRENATKKPKYVEKEKKLRVLYETISRMRENEIQWTQILQDPALARKQFTSGGDKLGFGLDDYQKFVQAVGEYLGNQFEPVPFDYRLHGVKFFDIENSTFITTENRHIHIDNLSQGQSKIASLTGSFKKMDPGKKKIVLIDEISELDPQNLQGVKDTLKSKFDDGSLLLAILLRPSSEMIEIKGWG